MKSSIKYFFLYFILLNLIASQAVFGQSAPCLTTDPQDFAFHTGNQIDSRLNSTNSSSGLSLFSSRPTTGGSDWTRNTNSWTQKGIPLDFTGVMGSNNNLVDHANNPYQGGLALITPRHFITAKHFKFADNTTINFFTNSGKVVSRKIVSSIDISGTDINVGVLDSDVDSSITYYPLISSTQLSNLISQINSNQISDIPIVVFNQNSEAVIRSLEKKDPKMINHTNYVAGLRSGFSKTLIMGDSGQPGFIIVNNKPILLFASHTTEYGPELGAYITEINSAINSLGNSGGYGVTEFNPSGFNTYSSFCTAPSLPVPSNFTATTQASCLSNASQGKVTVAWNHPANTSITSGYGYNLFVNEATTPFFTPYTQLSHIDSNVEPGNTYTYKLKTVRGGSSSSLITSQVKISSLCSNVTSPATQPSDPVVTISPTPSSVNTTYSISFSSTDPQGDFIYYEFDWDRNGTYESRHPTTGTVPSGGAPRSMSKTWTVAGDNSFRVRTVDSTGATSNYTTQTVILTNPVVAPPPQTSVNGSCSTTLNLCTTGTFLDVADTSTKRLWSCLGSNGGTSASCSIDIAAQPAPVPINGFCSKNLNLCTTGTPSDIPDSSTQQLWSCLGSNGGTNDTCSIDIVTTPAQAPVFGLCSTTLNQCSAGTLLDTVDSATQRLWSCLGSNGGTDSSCSQNIPIPVDDTPPTISSISESSLTSTQVTITFNTNELSDSRIEYGLTSAYGNSTTLNTRLATSHSQSLINLKPNTVYHYKIVTRDAVGNTSSTLNKTFTTLAVIVSDVDSDGVVDSSDLCQNTPTTIRSSVNASGCPKPKVDSFDIKPNLNSNLSSLSNVEIGRSNIGKISFLQPVTLLKDGGTYKDQLDIDRYVTFSQNRISLDSTNLPQLNVPAILTFFNINYTKPVIMRDGVRCTQCGIISYSNNILRVSVPGFSTYTVIEDTTTTVTIESVKVNGSCSNVLNQCKTGNYIDIIDNSSQKLWSCLGVNGGSNASCYINIVSNPIVNPNIQQGQQPVINSVTNTNTQSNNTYNIVKPNNSADGEVVDLNSLVTEESYEPIEPINIDYVELTKEFFQDTYKYVIKRIVTGFNNFIGALGL